MCLAEYKYLETIHEETKCGIPGVTEIFMGTGDTIDDDLPQWKVLVVWPAEDILEAS